MPKKNLMPSALSSVALIAVLAFGPVAAQPNSAAATASPAAATPSLQAAPPNTTSPAGPLTQQVTSLQGRTRQLEDELASYRNWIQWGLTIGGLIFAIASFFGWQSIRDYIRKLVERNLDAQLKSALEQKLPERLADVQAKAEGYLLRFARLQTLYGLGQFDEALRAYGWEGNVAGLRSESPPIRRLIIECLHSSRDDRKAKRQSAWEALNELIVDDSSIEAKRLFLRIVYASRKIREGVSFVDKHREELAGDRESALRASTLLRKANRQDEALKIVKGVYDPNDLECVVHTAVLQRDLGNFDEAHDVLTPAVTALVSDPKTKLPEGWHRVLNTFVANCIDRARPEDGLRSAEFVFRSAPGAVEVFTVGRLIKALPAANADRVDLLARFSAAIDGLAAGEAKLRCEVLRLQMSGDNAAAERMLKESIAAESRPGKREIDNDTYFQHCTLGEFYIDRGRPDDAIDVLMPAAGFNYGGEAKFYLAVAYALKKETRDSARWLTQAMQELPKWAAHARDHVAFKGIAEVAEVLLQHAQARQQRG